MNLQNHLEEIEILIENELGMERGELMKSLMEADRNDHESLTYYYSLQIFKNHMDRKQNISSDSCRWLIGTIQLLHTLSREKQPFPSEPYKPHSERQNRRHL